MKNTYVCLIIFCLLLVSCAQHNKTETGNSHSTNNPLSNPEENIHPVYELSPRVIAVCLIGDGSTSHRDNIYDNIASRIIKFDWVSEGGDYKVLNGTIYDSTGVYDLQTNDTLTLEIKKRLPQVWYVYGTRGFTKCQLKDIVFCPEQCRTSILAFTIDYDTVEYGHPLIACEQPLRLIYDQQNNDLEHKISEMIKNEHGDYANNLKTKIFAHIDSLYFTYSDNFKWGLHHRSGNGTYYHDSDCYLPGRSIIILRNDKLLYPWTYDLDLIGIPCD